MPYGLVRYGVAPDHQRLKSVAAVFERIGASESLRWLGGVEVGRDITVTQLLERYHAVVIACGTANARTLGVPGEALEGVCSSTDFVGWYNGHPDFCGTPPLKLTATSAVVLGHGNVAIDVTRLLSKTAQDLSSSDIPNAVLRAFEASAVNTVHLIGRGGPGRAKFTPKELRELGELPGVRVTFPQGAQRVMESLRAAPGNGDLLPVWQTLTQNSRADAAREIKIWFGLGASSFVGENALAAVRLQVTDPNFATEHDASEPLLAGHAISCIGYRGEPVSGVPFDADRGVVSNEKGRVRDSNSQYCKGLYVTGWIKRGPTGVIGTNRADSVETVNAMLEDWPHLMRAEKTNQTDVQHMLEARGVRVFSFADWRRLDALEKAQARSGAPREKVVTREQADLALE